MSEQMIPSFDGTKLYMKKETDFPCRAAVVIVHGLCEHQGRYDYFADKLSSLMDSYFKGGSVSTSGTGALMGTSGTGTMS